MQPGAFEVRGEGIFLQLSLEKVNEAVNCAREYNLKGRLGWALFIKASIHLALLEKETSHRVEALESTQEAMNLIEIEPNYWLMPENCLYLQARALQENGREKDADEYLQKAYDRVTMVAGNIACEDYRQSYLENVKVNREILATYRERFGE